LADGRDVRDLASDTVREGIAWCRATTHLFDNTLRANLLLSSPAATDDAVVAALERAQLGGWLAALPDGLDTAVGEHGGAVSGGERQRIGVSRALLAELRRIRRLALTETLERMSPAGRAALLRGLTEFAAAADETAKPGDAPARSA